MGRGQAQPGRSHPSPVLVAARTAACVGSMADLTAWAAQPAAPPGAAAPSAISAQVQSHTPHDRDELV